MDKETAIQLAQALNRLATALERISNGGGIQVHGMSDYVEHGFGPRPRPGGAGGGH